MNQSKCKIVTRLYKSLQKLTLDPWHVWVLDGQMASGQGGNIRAARATNEKNYSIYEINGNIDIMT